MIPRDLTGVTNMFQNWILVISVQLNFSEFTKYHCLSLLKCVNFVILIMSQFVKNKTGISESKNLLFQEEKREKRKSLRWQGSSYTCEIIYNKFTGPAVEMLIVFKVYPSSKRENAIVNINSKVCLQITENTHKLFKENRVLHFSPTWRYRVLAGMLTLWSSGIFLL